MIKYFIAFMLFTSPCLAGMGIGGFPYPGPGVMVASGGVCNSNPSITQDTHSLGDPLGQDASFYYLGIINESATPLSICSIDIYVRENGNLEGKTLYIEKWSYNSGTGALISKVSDVATVNASLFPSTINYYNIIVNVSLSQNQALIFTFNEVTGATNNLTVAWTSNPSVDNQHYRSWSSSLSYTTGGATSDMRMKLYGN